MGDLEFLYRRPVQAEVKQISIVLEVKIRVSFRRNSKKLWLDVMLARYEAYHYVLTSWNLPNC